MLKKIIMFAVSASLFIVNPLMAESISQLESGDVGNGVIGETGSSEKAIGWSSGGLIQEGSQVMGPFEGFTSINAMKLGA